MKKIIAMLLALTVVLGLAACGNDTAKDTTPATTEPVVDTTPATEEVTEGTEEIIEDTTPAPATNGATDVINAIWNAVPEDNKFFAMGGDFNNIADNAAGVYSLEDQEGLTATLLVPADQIANIDEAASLMHAMLANNFTCGAFHVTGDKAAFVEAMHDAVKNNRWMCGMPEKLIIAEIGEYVLVCFGINDAVTPFETALTTAHADATIKYNEAIAG